MSIVKKLSAGAWAACVTAVLTIVALIVYGVNVGAVGYFKSASVTNLVLFSVLAIIALLAIAAMSLVKVSGSAAIGVELASGVLQIVVTALLAFCLISLIAARVEGLGFIFFSNADVTKEVQTPENMSSASGAIASMVLFGVAMLAAIVTAFFNVQKKDTRKTTKK